MMPKKRSLSREEAFGATKTLKRLEHTNPLVRIDRMDDYLAIYHKKSDARPISFVYETFVVNRPPHIPANPEKLTVWTDVLQLDQNVSDMKNQLLQSEVEYAEAPEHIILGTRSVGGRAWCLHKAATRARVGKRSHVLKSLRCDVDPRFDIASFVATTSGRFYEEMQATMPADLELIRQRITETYGTPERFNGALLRIFQDAAF
jgi:hypothetical protein